MMENKGQPAFSSEREELLWHLLLQHTTLTEKLQLLVGELPPMPESLPLPEESRILGTFMRSSTNATIVLSTSLSPTGVLAFYKERLSALGWQEPENRFHSGSRGFTSTRLKSAYKGSFVHSLRGPTLFLFARESFASQTMVYLTLDLRVESAAQYSLSKMVRFNPEVFVPSLEPPPGGEQEETGRGGGGANYDMRATLRLPTEIELPVLLAHYNKQLEQTNWQLLHVEHAGPAGWSTWRLQSSHDLFWSGTFFALHVGIQPLYSLHFSIQIDNKNTLPEEGWSFF